MPPPLHTLPPPQTLQDCEEFIIQLLRRGEITAGGAILHPLELELYYWSPEHPDPFVHRHPLQREYGRWYLHRTGSGIRSGSFKGVDLTLGNGEAFVGVLIRAVRRVDGTIMAGPSLVVDHLLKLLKLSHPAELDRRVSGYQAWDRRSPLSVRWGEVRSTPVLRGPRVGLSLTRLAVEPSRPAFFARAYRYLTAAEALRAGRASLVISLYHQGYPEPEICRLTGVRLAQVRAYVNWFREGQGQLPAVYARRRLSVADECRRLGALSSSPGA